MNKNQNDFRRFYRENQIWWDRWDLEKRKESVFVKGVREGRGGNVQGMVNSLIRVDIILQKQWIKQLYWFSV